MPCCKRRTSKARNELIALPPGPARTRSPRDQVGRCFPPRPAPRGPVDPPCPSSTAASRTSKRLRSPRRSASADLEAVVPRGHRGVFPPHWPPVRRPAGRPASGPSLVMIANDFFAGGTEAVTIFVPPAGRMGPIRPVGRVEGRSLPAVELTTIVHCRPPHRHRPGLPLPRLPLASHVSEHSTGCRWADPRAVSSSPPPRHGGRVAVAHRDRLAHLPRRRLPCLRVSPAGTSAAVRGSRSRRANHRPSCVGTACRVCRACSP